MLRKLRTALSTSEGKLKAVILVSGITLLMLVFTAGALELTSTPTFCRSCHEMNPEYYTWQGSAHNQITCVKCHIKPGSANFVKHKIESLSQLYYHFAGTYPTPIEIKEKIDNSICMQCHDMDKRVTTPSGDIKFPHSKHLAEKVDCVDCHAGVVHGTIEEKGVTALTNFNKWNSYVGAAYLSGKFAKLEMSKCLECHKDRGAPQNCETCHSRLIKPDNHKTDAWLNQHGMEAAKDLSGCNKCHSKTFDYGVDPSGFDVVQYARANIFCAECHAKKPAGHTTAWRIEHIIPAKENRQLCFVCHSETKPGRQDKVPSTVECSDCHRTKHTLQQVNHPYPISPSGYEFACVRCHTRSTCEKCHIHV